jgi:DNA (cytosine-5)-methyltransferase 1
VTRVGSLKKSGLRLIDLFAGAGGLTLGFSETFGHPFVSIWANDDNPHAVATYNLNFGEHCVCGNIVELLRAPEVEIPKADVVVGGPPCQGFSLLNKKRGSDPRKRLWEPFFDVVRRSDADAFVMENVPQLLGTSEHRAILEEARRLGFGVACAVLLAADYGVPQLRRRAFILGCRFSDPSRVFPPNPTHRDPTKLSLFNGNRGMPASLPAWRTVRDAIFDLEPPLGTESREEPPPFNLHFGRAPTPLSVRRYRTIPKEGMNRFDLQRLAPGLTPKCWIKKKSGGTDLFGRLWWDRPAFTIRTEFFKPEKGRYLHPSQHRPITHREAARLQSFPDSFRFCGTKVEIGKQIGNAVPPLLAARIADCVEALFSERKHNRNGRHAHAEAAKPRNGSHQRRRHQTGEDSQEPASQDGFSFSPASK